MNLATSKTFALIIPFFACLVGETSILSVTINNQVEVNFAFIWDEFAMSGV